MNRFLCGSLLLSVMFLLDSCSLQRLVSGKKRQGTTVTVPDTTKIVVNDPNRMRIVLPEQDTVGMLPDTTGMMKQLVDMILPIYNNRVQFVTFTSKAKVHFEGPEDKQDFTANIRVKKDSVIWVDITALGGMVHAARAYITRDSFFMINYIQKTGTRIALTDVAKILPTQVDFSTLQNLIIGEPLRPGNIRDIAVLGNSWLVKVQDSSYAQNLDYRKLDSLLLSNQVSTLAPNGPQATLRYDNFESVNGKKVPSSRSVNIQNGNDKFLLEMELQNMEFDKSLETPFAIPKSFSTK